MVYICIYIYTVCILYNVYHIICLYIYYNAPFYTTWISITVLSSIHHIHLLMILT